MKDDSPLYWLAYALGFTLLAIAPLGLLAWWRGPRVLLNLPAFAGVVGGAIMLLVAFISAAWQGHAEWNVPLLLGGIAALAIGVAATRASVQPGSLDAHVGVLTVASGFWMTFWGYLAVGMWQSALGR